MIVGLREPLNYIIKAVKDERQWKWNEWIKYKEKKGLIGEEK